MRAFLVAMAMVAPAVLLSGCSGDGDKYTGSIGEDGVREVRIHIGWADDGASQYMRPQEVRVQQGEKVRFIVFNDDDPERDYNGDKSGRDNFHDVALLDYDGDGDGVQEDIEHEVPAGRSARTELKGNDYFVATTKGTFRIICEVRTAPSHDALGMHAAFIVE